MKNTLLLILSLCIVILFSGCNKSKDRLKELPVKTSETSFSDFNDNSEIPIEISSEQVSSINNDISSEISSTSSELIITLNPFDVAVGERVFVGIPTALVDPNAMTKLSHDDAISSVAKALLDKKVDLLDHKFVSLCKAEISGLNYLIVKEFIGEDDYSVKTLNWYYVNDEYGYIFIYDEITLEFERIY